MLLAVIDFIRENLSWILSLAAAIAAIIFTIIKKRPVANFGDRSFLNIALEVPRLISEAEIKFQRGEEKLVWVMTEIKKLILKNVIIDEESDEFLSILSTFQSLVEDVLDTPRKKVSV